MMRILFSSNAIWVNTGYGVQAKYLLPGFQRLGYEVAQFAFYGLKGARLNVGDLTIYPPGFDAWGSDIIGEHVEHFEADLVITMQDLWPMAENYQERAGVPWMPWFPVDQSPVPQAVTEQAKRARFPVTYSKWGGQMMAEAGVDCHYIPPGVDTSVFKPLDQAACRKKLGWPEDAFIVVMVGANKGLPSRKSFPEALEIFKRFQAIQPDAWLYLHTLETDATGGIDFKTLVRGIPGFPVERLGFVDQYAYLSGLPEQYLADVYNAADVLLQPSQSEGFGIPIIEAQACGTPVLTNQITAMPELTAAGLSLKPVQQFYTPLGGWVGLPSINRFVEGLEWAAAVRGDRALAQEGVDFAARYDWQTLIDEWWRPYLEYVADELS